MPVSAYISYLRVRFANLLHHLLDILQIVSVTFLLFTAFGGTAAQAQNQINILQADSIVGGNINGERVQKIIGNVRLQSDDLTMVCDSAYQFVNEDEFHAFGNIEINSPDENIWADTLIYYTDIDFSQLRGRVIIEADTTTLFGNSVDYRFSTKVGHFIDHVRLEDLQGVLIANSGFYYREADSAVFRGQVQLSDSLQYLEGDSLFTNRGNEYYEVHGDIFADDRENETMLKGNYLEADSTGRRLLEGNAWLMNYDSGEDPDSVQTDTSGLSPMESDTLQADTLKQKVNQPPPDSLRPSMADSIIAPPSPAQDSSGTDTTHIRAEEILTLREESETDTTTTVYAYHNVRIWSPKFAAIADTASYESSTETFELWSNPKAWHEEVQLTGPYILALLSDGDIEELTSYPNPFVVQQDTTLDRLNQIKGDTLNTYFTDGALSRILVSGNSHLLRFTKDENDEPDGAIEMTSPVTHIFFENGELVELKSIGSIDGSYLPESEQTAEKKLDGFTWDPKQKPQRPEQEMEPRFPPIPDDRPFLLPRRYREHIGEKTEEL